MLDLYNTYLVRTSARQYLSCITFSTAPTTKETLRDKLHQAGYFITRVDDQYYCIDFANRTIINMKDHGLDVSRLQAKQVQKQQDQRRQISGLGIGRAIDKVAKQRGGSSDSNREWEVGNRSYENDDKSMKL